MRRVRFALRRGAVHGDAALRENPAARRRKSELYDIAFLLLGGRRAAQAFLYEDHPVLDRKPFLAAMASPLGLIEAVYVLRREALACRVAQSPG